MPIYWNPDLGERKPLGIEDYEPLFGDMLGIGFRTGKELNPLSILARRQDMIGWEEGPGLTDAGEALDLIPNLDDYREQISKPAVPEDEQARQIKESGLEGKIKPQAGYNQDALNIVMENAHMENVASLLRENASGLQMIPDFVGGMAASMIDPVNLATAFFPAVPEQRFFSMLRKTSGAWGRAGVRTATGVASGALGAAVVEPMISLGQHEVQADYDFTDSLLNIGMGAALGGLLHPVGGAFGDLYRNMHGLKHPWEYVPPNDKTEALMKAHADEIYNHWREADPSANPDKLRKQADHYAALFDARARSWAYQEKRPVTDYYAENKPRYKSWQDFDPDGWRDLVPENWRSPGSKVGDELEDLSWVGKEYEGLRGLTADAMTAPQFLEEMGKWEGRFPDMADYQGIRAGIEDLQARGMTAKKITLVDKLSQSKKEKNLASIFADMPALKLSSADIVGEGLEIQGSGKNLLNSARQWANNHFKNGTKVKNKDNGWEIIISKKGIKDTLYHGGDELIGKTIPFLEEIIRTSKYIAAGKTTDKIKTHIYGNKINFDGKDYIIGLVIREDANGKRFYDHEITKVLNLDWSQRANNKQLLDDPLLGLPNRGSVMNILREELGVNDGTGKILFQSASQPATGNKTRILSANSSEIAQYELWELDDVIPSHDPERQFARREDYPEMAQERPYHSDLGEQEKVINNAIRYDPDHVANLDSMAVSGPPIITSKGIVLGGNSRTMTLALVYGRHPEKAKAYIQALKDKAQSFGLDAKAIDGMKKPILVRRISGELSPEEMALKSREYNQNPSQVLQAQAEGVSRARFIGGQSMNLLATGLRENESLAKFLDNETSAGFVNALIDEGVILPTEKSAFTNANGSLNNVGKDHVTNILRGMTIPDYDLLARLPAGVLDKLDVAIPAIALLRMRGEGWDISGAIYAAMRFISMSKAKKQSLWNLFFQNTLGKPDHFADNAVVQALALTFNKGGVREIRMRMNAFLELARNKNAGQASLLGDSFTISPEQAFRKAFLEDMAFIGKERIREFDPAKNDLDAAIQWAVDSKAKTIEDALAKLEKKLGSKKVSEADKKSLALYRKELTPYSGSLGIDKPKAGEGWPDPGKLEFPEPKKTGEKGAMPEIVEEPETHFDLNDPDSMLPPELTENPPKDFNRGMVEFDTDLGQPVITLFKSADASTIPHEFFHIFRRDLEKSALNPEAGDLSKEQWRIACKFVGAKEGEAWTREMEEKFADAGLRYLAEGKAPNKGLAGIFERIKQWLMEIYQKATNAGVDISPQMRKVFDDMFSIPHDKGDFNFRYALGEMHARRPERVFANPDSVGRQMDPDEKAYLDGEAGNELKLLDEMAVDDEARAREALARLEQQDAEIAGHVLDPETKENIEIARREYEHVDVRDEARRQALECFMGGAS